MRFITAFYQENYLTVMLLAAFAVLVFMNRATDRKVHILFAVAMTMTLGIAILDQVEEWCDFYQKPVWILYVKCAMVYTIYPLILLIESLVTLKIKRQVLYALPLLVNTVLLCINACGIDLIYGYHDDHSYLGGTLNFFPTLVMLFYEVVISREAIRMMQRSERQRGTVLLFIVVASVLTVVLEWLDFVTGYTDEICALSLLVYFWYIAADDQQRVRDQLYQTRLEAERNKNEMLMAQIQPHFINNSLMALRARCRNTPEIYDSITKFSRYLRSHFDALSEASMITFEREMENVEAYLDLERDNYGERLEVEYDIECDQFLVPALSVQPLVENAVRHGIGTYEKGGTVCIAAHRLNGKYCIEITDDGSGESDITQQQKKRKGIGIENVRTRLQTMGSGVLEIISSEHGTTARIILDAEQEVKT